MAARRKHGRLHRGSVWRALRLASSQTRQKNAPPVSLIYCATGVSLVASAVASAALLAFCESLPVLADVPPELALAVVGIVISTVSPTCTSSKANVIMPVALAGVTLSTINSPKARRGISGTRISGPFDLVQR